MKQLDFGFEIEEGVEVNKGIFGTSRITVSLKDPKKAAFEHLHYCLRQLSESTQIITDPSSDKYAIAEAERLGELFDEKAVRAREEYEALAGQNNKVTQVVEVNVQQIRKEDDFHYIRVTNLANNKFEDYYIQDRSDWEHLAKSQAFAVNDADGNIIAEVSTLKAAVNKAKKNAANLSEFRTDVAQCNNSEMTLFND